MDRFLSVPSAAKILDLSEQAIRGMIKRREIKFYKVGSRVRIAYSDLKKILITHPAKSEVSLDSLD